MKIKITSSQNLISEHEEDFSSFEEAFLEYNEYYFKAWKYVQYRRSHTYMPGPTRIVDSLPLELEERINKQNGQFQQTSPSYL